MRKYKQRRLTESQVSNEEAIAQYHALDTFQKFWAAIAEEKLLAVPLDPKICKPFGGFASRG